MEQRIDEERDQSTASAENKDLQDHSYCLNCRTSFIDEEIEDHEGCQIRRLSSMVAEAKKEHAGWKEMLSEAPILIHNQSRLIDEAADSAIEIASKEIRAKAEDRRQKGSLKIVLSEIFISHIAKPSCAAASLSAAATRRVLLSTFIQLRTFP